MWFKARYHAQFSRIVWQHLDRELPKGIARGQHLCPQKEATTFIHRNHVAEIQAVAYSHRTYATAAPEQTWTAQQFIDKTAYLPKGGVNIPTSVSAYALDYIPSKLWRTIQG